MALFYSATAGFLDDAIHASLPADAVAISAARHAKLLAAQASGATIEASEGGKPRARRAVLSLVDRRAICVRQVKREAARRIEMVSPLWRQLNDLRDIDPAQPRPASSPVAMRFAAIDAIRTASDEIEMEIAAADADGLTAMDIGNHVAWPPKQASA